MIYKKNYISQTSRIFPRYARLAQHQKIYPCNEAHQQTKEEKS